MTEVCKNLVILSLTILVDFTLIKECIIKNLRLIILRILGENSECGSHGVCYYKERFTTPLDGCWKNS